MSRIWSGIAIAVDNDLSDSVISPRRFLAKLAPAIRGRTEVHVAAFMSNFLQSTDQDGHSLLVALDLNLSTFIGELKAEHGILHCTG
jgi:hypothetical protein